MRETHFTYIPTHLKYWFTFNKEVYVNNLVRIRKVIGFEILSKQAYFEYKVGLQMLYNVQSKAISK